MSEVSVESYLQMEDMEEGTSKKDLQALVDAVDNDNQGYVMKHLQSIFDSYVSSHVHEDLRKMEVVMRRVRQEFTLKTLAKIMSDYIAMAKFVPDVKVEDAHGMSSEDAQALLEQLCPSICFLWYSMTNAFGKSAGKIFPMIALPAFNTYGPQCR